MNHTHGSKYNISCYKPVFAPFSLETGYHPTSTFPAIPALPAGKSKRFIVPL